MALGCRVKGPRNTVFPFQPDLPESVHEDVLRAAHARSAGPRLQSIQQFGRLSPSGRPPIRPVQHRRPRLTSRLSKARTHYTRYGIVRFGASTTRSHETARDAIGRFERPVRRRLECHVIDEEAAVWRRKRFVSPNMIRPSGTMWHSFRIRRAFQELRVANAFGKSRPATT